MNDYIKETVVINSSTIPTNQQNSNIQTEMNFLSKLLISNKQMKIKNLNNVAQKLQKIKQNGTQNLCIVSDFDATISKHHAQNDPKKQRLPSTFGLLEGETGLPKDTAKYLKANYEKYYPLEMDLSIEKEVKNKLMMEWWTSSQKAMIDCGVISNNVIKEAAVTSKMQLRDTFDNLCKKWAALDIPVVIFSAGCGNVIYNVLKYKEPKCWYKQNMVIVSNELEFGKDQKALRFAPPLIYTMNKFNACDRLKERNSPDTDKFSKLIDGKSSVILMGDHLRDVDMANGMKHVETTLSIGFLNVNLEKNLETYLEMFDIVLVDDQSMFIVEDIFNYL